MKREQEAGFWLGDMFRVIVKNGIHQSLHAQIDDERFHAFMGEAGLGIDPQNLLALPVSVFDRQVLTPGKIPDRYIDLPPKIVVEMDIQAALPDQPDMELFSHFVLHKVRRLLAFGTGKVAWVFSKRKLVLIASSNAPWQILDWNEDVELFDGVKFNVVKLLEEEGFDPDAV